MGSKRSVTIQRPPSQIQSVAEVIVLGGLYRRSLVLPHVMGVTRLMRRRLSKALVVFLDKTGLIVTATVSQSVITTPSIFPQPRHARVRRQLPRQHPPRPHPLLRHHRPHLRQLLALPKHLILTTTALALFTPINSTVVACVLKETLNATA